nr:unnamed protein product [Callosobruchus analis]
MLKTFSRRPKRSDVIEKVVQCIEKTEIGSNTMCTTIGQNLPKCAKPIVDLLTPCVEEKYQYVLPLTLKLITGFVQGACDSTVEELLELLNPCVFDVDEEEENKIDSCKKINEKIKDDTIPTKDELCGMKADGDDCITKLTDTCKNPLTKKVSMRFSGIGTSIIGEQCAAGAA